MVTLREFGAYCCKASCAGNGYSIGKYDNVAAVRAKPRPRGLTAEPARSKTLPCQVGTCLQKCAVMADSAVSQSGHRLDQRLPNYSSIKIYPTIFRTAARPQPVHEMQNRVD